MVENVAVKNTRMHSIKIPKIISSFNIFDLKKIKI